MIYLKSASQPEASSSLPLTFGDVWVRLCLSTTGGATGIHQEELRDAATTPHAQANPSTREVFWPQMPMMLGTGNCDLKYHLLGTSLMVQWL